MPRLLEKLGKELFEEEGIDCPTGEVATSPEEAANLSRSIDGSVVLKAHIPVGKRGKAGGVLFADTPDEAREKAENLLGKTIHNFPVDTILVEKALPIDQEMYASVTFDSTSRSPTLVFSSRGGMDIETISEEYPDAVVQRELDPVDGLEPFEARQIAVKAGIPRDNLVAVGIRLVQLVEVFQVNEAELVEINPLARCEGDRVVAADAVVKLDDNAEDRHPTLFNHRFAVSGSGWRPPTSLEREVHEADSQIGNRRVLRFMELEGDIGNCITGGGGSLMALDTFRQYDAKPSTYLDATPTQNPAKYELATLAALKSGIKGLVFGSNITSLAKTDIKARGLVNGLKRANVDPREFPVVARLAGPNQDRAEEILEELSGIESVGNSVTMEEAIKRLIDRTEDKHVTKVNVDLIPEENR